MNKLESFIPIVFEHNYASAPLGHVKFDEGKVVMKLREDAGISVEDINTMNKVFSPSYIVTKEKDGVVLECELLYMSVNINHR